MTQPQPVTSPLEEYAQTLDWDTAATAAGFDGLTFTLTNDASTDATTQRVVVIENSDDGGSTGTTEALLVLDNADTNEAVTDALIITSSGAGGITTALNINDTDITTDISLQNGETIANDTDDIITFIGIGGADNTDLYIDLDGTHPVLYSQTDTLVEINDALTVAGAVAGVTTLSSSGDWTWTATTPSININSTEVFTISDGTDTFTVDTSGSLMSFSDGTNSFTFDVDSGPSYAGTARPAKTVTLSPEYAGAVLSSFYGAGTDSNINGTMTSDAETTAADSLRTYYEWERAGGTQHFHTVAVRVTLPADFSAWATSNAFQVDFETESTTTTNSDLDVRIYLESDATTAVASSTDNASASANTWETITIDDSTLDDGGAPEWDAAGETAIIYLRMGSQSANHVRIGDITLNYLAQF